ncbi:zinc-ribbon domain-containing protein [Tritonibacter horizontis]|uniref:Zinc finger/thioredoxin putative domain-containing protein n=1 Tax=Tritonibacter horizontis TaxID=1768241 RepID=A0A132BTW5_9RHOB|nr:zinc-ribbon domain-containing protein [Tritonibacter horizontis]KUP91835.1 hypothetical protein TRIHO_33050 [Tritonibacter horizontis]
MRLICPNCGAQYEVPEDVIPAEGRDVQCSNCGDTWFQPSAAMLAQTRAQDPESEELAAAETGAAPADLEAPEDVTAPAEPEHRDETAPGADDPAPVADDADEDAPVAATREAADDTTPPEASPDDAIDADEPTRDVDADVAPAGPDAAVDPAPEPPVQRRLDPDVSRVLREEAMREAALRAGQENIETQTEMGFAPPSESDVTRRAREAQDRVARLRGEDPDAFGQQAVANPAIDPVSRRGLLPDIEDISQGLRGGQDQKHAPAPEPHYDDAAAGLAGPRKSGFSRGFLLVILAMVVAVLIYSNAPVIAEQLPQADPYLSSYVAWVDQIRLWLDAQAGALAAG